MTGGLRLPSDLSSEPSGPEDSTGRVRDHSDRAVLASTPVVSAHGGSSERTPVASASGSIPASQTRRSRTQAHDRSAQVDCLALIRDHCQQRGFSQRSAELIAGGRRDSTLRVYSQRLGPYYRWCQERGISPTRAPVTRVAELLTCKFDKGLEAGTIRNYKSDIFAVHKGFADGTSLKR